jgi:predicted TIM-barrel fold metal-dependent hydrolase
VVLDHLPNLDIPGQTPAARDIEAALKELASRNTFAKLSAVTKRVNGQVQTDVSFYKPKLDLLCEIFGEDKVLYGSDWPNSTGNWAPYETMILQTYFQTRGRAAAEKYFWKNSVAAYHWIKRDGSQPDPTSARSSFKL